MSFTLRAENFKGLRRFDWSPAGVCALVGPNGAGKTTALKLLECLRVGLEKGFVAGLQQFGSGPLRHLDADKDELCTIKLEVDNDLHWTLLPERSWRIHERVNRGGTDIVFRAQGDQILRTSEGNTYLAQDEMALHRAANADEMTARQVEPLVRFVRNCHYYARYRLEALRDAGSPLAPEEMQLDDAGSNVFGVLRAWRDRSAHEHRFNFVTERLSAIFPGWFRRFDFEAVAQRVSASVVHPRWTERFSPADWYDGFFVVLLHLTALASSEPGGVVAIDQPEDSLHPELVREVIGAMRDWSATHDVTVVLATHSPVVLDQFREDPDQVYVMEPGHERQPVELDTLKKRVWLEHYSLGDLYSHGEVGAPRNSA